MIFLQQDACLSLLNAPKCSNIRHWQFLISFLYTSCLPEQACGTGTGEPKKEQDPEVTKALDMIINNTRHLPNEAGAERAGVSGGRRREVISASFSCRAGEASLTTVIFKYYLRAAPRRLAPSPPTPTCTQTSPALPIASPAPRRDGELPVPALLGRVLGPRGQEPGRGGLPPCRGGRCREPLDGKLQTRVGDASKGLIGRATLPTTTP